mgnify:FL=1
MESACGAAIQITGRTEPSPASKVYQEVYPLYRDLYPALQPTFNAITRAAG